MRRFRWLLCCDAHSCSFLPTRRSELVLLKFIGSGRTRRSFRKEGMMLPPSNLLALGRTCRLPCEGFFQMAAMSGSERRSIAMVGPLVLEVANRSPRLEVVALMSLSCIPHIASSQSQGSILTTYHNPLVLSSSNPNPSTSPFAPFPIPSLTSNAGFPP